MSDVRTVKTALVLGGASDIGLAIVRRLGENGLVRVVLAARDADALRARLGSDSLPVEQVAVERWDALEPDSHESLMQSARATLGTIDVVVCAVGSLGHHSGLSV